MMELFKINLPSKYVSKLQLMYIDFCLHWLDMGMDEDGIPSFEQYLSLCICFYADDDKKYGDKNV